MSTVFLFVSEFVCLRSGGRHLQSDFGLGRVASCSPCGSSFVRLRGFAASARQPSRGLPTGAHARVGKRERRLVRKGGFEPPRSCERQPLKLLIFVRTFRPTRPVLTNGEHMRPHACAREDRIRTNSHTPKQGGALAVSARSRRTGSGFTRQPDRPQVDHQPGPRVPPQDLGPPRSHARVHSTTLPGVGRPQPLG